MRGRKAFVAQDAGDFAVDVENRRLRIVEEALRGEVGLAAQTYVDVAKRTRDPRVARRAIEIANAARLPDLAVEAAQVWYAVEPSPQSLQALAAFLVANPEFEEIFGDRPALKKPMANGPLKAQFYVYEQ
jgi:hypothetical protein